jgi:chromosome segregation ATPase
MAMFGAERLPAALAAQDAFLELPRSLGALLSGLGMGFIVGSSTIIRHLRWVRSGQLDRQLVALLPAAGAEDEVATLVRQAVDSYQRAIDCLDEHAQASAAASQLVLKIARFGKKWRDIEAQLGPSDRTQLEQRQADLRQRIQQSTDDGVRSEYQRALSAVAEQLTSIDEIDKGRQRAIARLHHQVATLDRLRLAALRHRSVGAAKLGEELRSLVDELNQAGQELDTAAEVLAELPS